MSTTDALSTFTQVAHNAWGPLSTELVAACTEGLTRLVAAPPTEPWLAALHRDAPASRELYRDPEHGFVLLGHAESAGLYRPPHDHGRSWVLYAVQRGAIEMGSYARLTDPDGAVRLVRRDSGVVSAGQVRVYLPGDIHDTRCVADGTLLFRFTERDLKREGLEAGRITRYVLRGDVWTVS